MSYRIYEFNIDTQIIDVSDTEAKPLDNKCFKYFKDILAKNLPATGWEIDSSGNRLGLFFHDQSSISTLLDSLKVTESDVHMLGVFFDNKGKQTIRIIKKYFGDDFDKGITWVSFNYGQPDDISYELRASSDVAKFISLEELGKIKTKIPKSEKFRLSHVKVKDSKLLKVYFIEDYITE